MSLGAISQEFLQAVETATGRPVHVETDSKLQPPLLARLQLARGGAPIHRVVYHPNAQAVADYLIAFQCSFALRLFALPADQRFDLVATPDAETESLRWVKTHPASASLPPDRQRAYAEFLQNSLLTMVRSIPIGLRIDQDLRARFPALREPQEQAIRRQIDTHASVLRPEVQRSVPEAPYRMSLGVNATFAKVWSALLGESGWTLPYVAAGAMSLGDRLLDRFHELAAGPENDQQLITAWAKELGLHSWLRWEPYAG